jgi:hypothetical protein
MTNDITAKIKELFDDFYADGYKKLPFKYDGGDVYEATYNRLVMIGKYPPYVIVRDGEAELAEEYEAEEIFELSYLPENRIASAGYDSTEMSDEWAERLADDIDN